MAGSTLTKSMRRLENAGFVTRERDPNDGRALWLVATNEGRQMLDEVLSTPWQPVLSHANPQQIAAGEIVPVDIEILPSSTLFRAGESLQLDVQGRDLFEHPALAHGYSDGINVGAHSIHTGATYDSHLLVPVVPAE